ncbi:Polycomb protein, partial [Globisporangium splendens]
MDANGKRKRDERDDGRKSKERRVKSRQEDMDDEFKATYLRITAFYKYLEMVHLKSPLLLPRTLKYRIEAKKKAIAAEKRQQDATAIKPIDLSIQRCKAGKDALAPTGAALKEFKLGMTAETLDVFKRENHRIGLLISVFTTKGEKFADSQFQLVATSLIPGKQALGLRVSEERDPNGAATLTSCVLLSPIVFCAQTVTLGKQFIRSNVDMYLLLFQVVDTADIGHKLAQDTSFSFAAPTSATTFQGKDLVSQDICGRPPLFGNMLRVDVRRWRNGFNSIDLPAVSSAVKGAVQLQFRVLWNQPIKTKRIQNLHQIALKQFKVPPLGSNGATSVKKDAEVSYTVDAPKHNQIPKAATKSQNSGVGHDNMAHIYVMATKSNWESELNADFSPSPCEIDISDDAMDRIEHHFSYVSTKKRSQAAKTAEENTIEERMHEFDELEDLSKEQSQEFYKPLLQRQYFHSRTGAVVLDHEQGYDSDDDVDEEWIIKQSEKLLDEFEDVALEEKEFMKKWNRHVKENRIMERGLRYNFLLHLFNLWDNSLLNSRAIIDCMLIVDHIAVLEETKPKAEGINGGAKQVGVTAQ